MTELSPGTDIVVFRGNVAFWGEKHLECQSARALWSRERAWQFDTYDVVVIATKQMRRGRVSGVLWDIPSSSTEETELSGTGLINGHTSEDIVLMFLHILTSPTPAWSTFRPVSDSRRFFWATACETINVKSLIDSLFLCFLNIIVFVSWYK